jgi:hypothetical protein
VIIYKYRLNKEESMAKFEYKDYNSLDYYEKKEYKVALYHYQKRLYGYFWMVGVFILVFLFSLITN